MNMLSSSSRQTPVGAIRTTLATRSSPSISPSTHTYEPIAKSVLRHRLIYDVFFYSGLLSWMCTSGWAMWTWGGFSVLGVTGAFMVPFKPWTLFCAFITWISGAVPAAVLRKVFLTPTRTHAASPSTLIKGTLAKTSTSRALVVYSLSALVAVTLNVVTVYYIELPIHGDPKLSFFVKSRKHPYYLNGRLLFLLLSQLFTALGFTLRNVMLDRFVFCWPLAASASQNNQKRLRFDPFDIVKAVLIATMLAPLVTSIASVVFGLGRFMLPVAYRFPFLHRFLRPFTAHFLRGPWAIFLPFRHISLLFRAWALSFTTIFTWELSNTLFETFIHQPITVGQATPEPHVTLVSGISSVDMTLRFFAYAELRTLASDTSTSASVIRGNLFNDQKYNPALWSHLARESLLFLGRDYQLFLRRGKPADPINKITTPPALPTTPAELQVKATPVPLIRTSVFRSNKQSSPMRSVIDGLGSDGALVQALDAGAEAAHIPELFRSMEAAVSPTTSSKEGKKVDVKSLDSALSGVMVSVLSRVGASLGGTLNRAVPVVVARYWKDLRLWWTRERMEKVVQGCLPNREMDVLVVEVLSHLICASLTEDRYGFVQRDIPKILEAMLSFLSAIEEYQVEVGAMYVPPSADQNVTPEELQKAETARVDVASANEVLGFVSAGLKDGIARIVRTFGDKLLAFKFPPRTARKLQLFLEYC